MMERDQILAEEIETRAMLEMHEAGAPEMLRGLGMRIHRAGGAVIETCETEPHALFNRAIGLGVEEPATREDIDAVTGCFRSNRIYDYYIHIHPDALPPDLRDRLGERGLREKRAWVKFLRNTDPATEGKTDLDVREIDATHALDFGRIVCTGFEFRPGTAEALAAAVGRPGWRVFMSFDGDTPAGAGLLYVHDDVGWFSYAATDPAFRGRGSQTAIMARRIEAAREMGCRLLVTETGEEVEGKPQISWRNIERAGFRPVYRRENWAPAG